MEIRISIRVHNAFGFLGTGIWPCGIGSKPSNAYIHMDLAGHPVVGLYRDYVAFAWLPLVPLGLAQESLILGKMGSFYVGPFLICWEDVRYPIRSQVDKRNITDLVSYRWDDVDKMWRNDTPDAVRGAVLRRSWLLAFGVSVCGAVIGWLLAPAIGAQAPLGAVVSCGLSNRALCYLFSRRVL